MDRRATAEVDAVNANVDVARLQAITGNGVDSYYGFTKMLWIREHLPEVWAKTRWFLPPNSYVNWRLSGELAVDHSSAGNIGGVYDAAQRSWSHEALGMLGIPARMMPPRLVESSEVVGGLSAEWAAKLGLAEGMPLMGGGVDAAVATFCAGVTGSGDHVAMIGTSMCWGFVSPTVDARHKLITMPHVYRGADRSYVFGGAITAGAAVTWFREAFCQAEVAEAARTGEDAHALIERKAIEVPPGAEGLVFLPYLMGERSPIWDAQAKGAFIGLSLAHSRAHMYRAVLEGVSFALQHSIEAGRQSGQPLDDRLIVVGARRIRTCGCRSWRTSRATRCSPSRKRSRRHWVRRCSRRSARGWSMRPLPNAAGSRWWSARGQRLRRKLFIASASRSTSRFIRHCVMRCIG